MKSILITLLLCSMCLVCSPAVLAEETSTSESLSPYSGDPVSSPYTAGEEGDNTLFLVGIGAWAALLIGCGVLLVVILSRKNHPPSGGSGQGLSGNSKESAAYRQRLQDDQRYRRY